MTMTNDPDLDSRPIGIWKSHDRLSRFVLFVARTTIKVIDFRKSTSILLPLILSRIVYTTAATKS